MTVEVVIEQTNQAAVQVLSTSPVSVEVTPPEDPKITVTAAERGPAGTPGVPGGAYYVHEQTTPSALWVVNHNFGFRPSVELIDAGGNAFNARVLHVTNNHFLVYLTVATAGQAVCI